MFFTFFHWISSFSISNQNIQLNSFSQNGLLKQIKLMRQIDVFSLCGSKLTMENYIMKRCVTLKAYSIPCLLCAIFLFVTELCCCENTYVERDKRKHSLVNPSIYVFSIENHVPPTILFDTIFSLFYILPLLYCLSSLCSQRAVACFPFASIVSSLQFSLSSVSVTCLFEPQFSLEIRLLKH